ncbi:MAG: energy transducer TonB [Sphingobium sp.]
MSVPSFQLSGSTGGRYGAGRPNLPAIAAVLLIHAVLIGALIQARHHYVRASETKMVVVNLTPAPPPPPPAAEEPPPPAVPEVVSPPPIVFTPVPPRPQVRTAPEPTPISAPVTAPPAPAAPPSKPAGPSTVQAGDLGAQMVSGRPPRYPTESRRKREQGTVLLSLVVGLDGRVMTIAVANSSGFSRLDRAALDAVRLWRWTPVIRDGQPVLVRGVVEIPFILT